MMIPDIVYFGGVVIRTVRSWTNGRQSFYPSEGPNPAGNWGRMSVRSDAPTTYRVIRGGRHVDSFLKLSGAKACARRLVR